MAVRQLWLTDFRSYGDAHVEFTDGTTVIVGNNGQGKTNLLEAIGWLSNGSSLRGVSNDALIRSGSDRAIVRAELTDRSRPTRLEAEIVAAGRNRIQVNGQRITKIRDLLGHLRTTVFAPDDLVLVKGGPGVRRGFLDDLLIAVHPRNHALRTDLERVLKQRNSLLKQSGGRATPEILSTLDVWDTKLTDVGERLVDARRALVDDMAPQVGQLYRELSESDEATSVRYVSDWEPGELHDRLQAGREADLRRGVTLIGPHRDDLGVELESMPARTHASQGEQRSLSLALRLAGHRVVAARAGTEPILLLDDVFSELDPRRSGALLRILPETQAIITTAVPLDELVEADEVYRVADGRVVKR